MSNRTREQNMRIREQLKFLEHLSHLAMIDIDTCDGDLDNLLIAIQDTVRRMIDDKCNQGLE